MTPASPTTSTIPPSFARRTTGVRTSFIREILKVTENPAVISFAGGLPSPELFPVDEVAEAARAVLADHGRAALQYSTTEGFLPLREWIARRYAGRFGLEVSPEEILVTTGSQQGLDLIAKVFIDPGSPVLVEQPGYLGALQAFSVYEPEFVPLPSGAEGPEPAAISEALRRGDIRLFYTVPNFQNPTGACFSAEARHAAAEGAAATGATLVEDDPYGELRYAGSELPPLRRIHPSTLMLGSFSKVVAPGLRLGWVCAPREVIRRLVVMKQAADLHTDIFSQRLLHRYLSTTDFEAHLGRLRSVYGRRCAAMVDGFRSVMPAGAHCNRPDGGMFLWATLPEGVSSRALFDRAAAREVAFVPGTAFHIDGGGDSSMRLNFTNTPEDRIAEGLHRLAGALREELGR